MKTNQYLVTSEGLKELKEELELRENVKRVELRDAKEDAASKGDLSENDAYTIAIEDFQNNEARFEEVIEIIKNAKVVKAKNSDKTEIGDRVSVMNPEGKVIEYKLVGKEEGNPLENKISYESPLGQALLGKEKGAIVVIDTPKGKIEYKVTKVE